MDARGCKLWVEKVWAPYVAGQSNSVLLLAESKGHLQGPFNRQLADMGTEVAVISGGYTCVLQPYDVGINKPLKDALRAQYDTWAAVQMVDLRPDQNVPVSRREDIVPMLANARYGITSQSIRDTFASIGYGVRTVVSTSGDSRSGSDDAVDSIGDELLSISL
ncbi:hypothetical protein BBJ28_00026839 [Nothophytophthora sp. Chile5]|nr:hypothetical protein BBJ28_00026839 [Nothophytophthora sp. Chile5]